MGVDLVDQDCSSLECLSKWAVTIDDGLRLGRRPGALDVRRGGWRAATWRQRYDLMSALVLAFADVRRNAMYVVIKFCSETPFDRKNLIVWIRNHLQSP